MLRRRHADASCSVVRAEARASIYVELHRAPRHRRKITRPRRALLRLAGIAPLTAPSAGALAAVGIHIGRQALANVGAVIKDNSDQGVVVQFQSTFELSGSISGNGSVAAHISEGSVARFTTAAITGNAGAGVLMHDLSMVSFNGATVTGNGGGTDVVCAPQFPSTRGTTTDINGGTTNCVEP
jgi:hypothetical protein